MEKGVTPGYVNTEKILRRFMQKPLQIMVIKDVGKVVFATQTPGTGDIAAMYTDHLAGNQRETRPLPRAWPAG